MLWWQSSELCARTTRAALECRNVRTDYIFLELPNSKKRVLRSAHATDDFRGRAVPIGRLLKEYYNALAIPVPPHLVALVEQVKNAEVGEASGYSKSLSAATRVAAVTS